MKYPAAILISCSTFACIAASWICYRIKKQRSSQELTLAQFKVEEVLLENSDIITLVGTFQEKEGRALVELTRTGFVQHQWETLTKMLQLKLVHHNDIYRTFLGFSSCISLNINIIYPATERHIDKKRPQNFCLIRETAEMYENKTREYINNLSPISNQWVYNILDGKSEVDDIIFNNKNADDGFVLLPDTKWPSTRPMEQLYCLAICHRRDIRSIRDLHSSHLNLLRNILKEGIEAITAKYNISANMLRVFVHYLPTFYHFHVHFTNIKMQFGVSAEKAHLLETIIGNIEQNPAYYQQATLIYAVGTDRDKELISRLSEDSP